MGPSCALIIHRSTDIVDDMVCTALPTQVLRGVADMTPMIDTPQCSIIAVPHMHGARPAASAV